jgi:hypothetical protein
MNKKLFIATLSLLAIILSACDPAAELSKTNLPPATSGGISQVGKNALVPDFTHIIIIPFENLEFGEVIGNKQMPNYNLLAAHYTLLTQYYAIRHPSLPNYIALMGGDTFGISKDCTDCFINAPSLADQIESSGRTWKAYLEDMPSPCFVGDRDNYVQKHNPFIYFDSIRLDEARCKHSVVPMTELSTDLAAGTLPNFVYIMPNLCHSLHDASPINPLCSPDTGDDWLGYVFQELQPSLDATGQPYLIIATWDEGTTDKSCCGLAKSAGGRIATVLISPQAKGGFQDDTPYTHYSLLKTIETAWNLPLLGHAADAGNTLIVKPWK